MKGPLVIQVFLLCVLASAHALAQRGHEIQIQFGVLFNKGVSFYDYSESSTKRHNFEFDHKYSSEFCSISWRYPLNSYLEAGIYFSSSLWATLSLVEAESILFNSDIPDSRGPSPLFLGTTSLSSKSREMGVDLRVILARFNKFKTYVALNAGIQQISVTSEPGNVVEVQHPELRDDLLTTYLVDEKTFYTVGIGLGLSRLLANGVNIKIIEIFGRNQPENKLLLSFPVSIEFRIGLSYQFYKRI